MTAPTLITEIGGFVNNCKAVTQGLPQCPGTLPFTVQIRRSANGVPDASTVLARLVLSHDDQPLVYSYESATQGIALAAGTYFALFAPQNGDEGSLLSSASSPFSYLAGLTTLGYLDPVSGASSSSEQYGAVRIRGILLPSAKEECKNSGWQNFGIFKNQGDCIRSIAANR